jgi:hypothetical protein
VVEAGFTGTRGPTDADRARAGRREEIDHRHRERTRKPDERVNREVLSPALEPREVGRIDPELFGEFLLSPAAIDAQLVEATADVADDSFGILTSHAPPAGRSVAC